MAEHWISERFGFLVMDRWDMTLSEWRRRHYDSSLTQVPSVSCTLKRDSVDIADINEGEAKCEITSLGQVSQQNTDGLADAVRLIISHAKALGHKDVKEANVVVKLDSTFKNVVKKVGIIDWDKIDPCAAVRKRVMAI